MKPDPCDVTELLWQWIIIK